MIKVQVRRDVDNKIKSFLVQGHAGFAEKGNDIVCSAVSTLIQTAIVGIEEVLKIRSNYINLDGYIFFELPVMARDKKSLAHFLLETIYNAFLGIRENYSGYISIEEVLIGSEKNKNCRIISAKNKEEERFREKLEKGGNEMEERDYDSREDDRGERKKVPWDKLLGVALIGAISSAFLYYIFLQLGEEQKQKVKDTIISQAKVYLAKLADRDVE